jgi:hypothetical protein
LGLRLSEKNKKLVIIGFVFVFFLLVYIFIVQKDMTDFGVCYQSGTRIAQGEMLYQVSDGHLQFKYSPAAAVFFSVLALFPYEMAKVLWYFLEIYLLFLCLTASYDILPAKHKKKGWVVALSFLVLLKFIGREMELGQVNIFLTYFLIMMVITLLEKKDVQAGLFWGFSLFFKPYALVFLPYFILKKRIKMIASGLGTLVIGLMLPVFFYGFQQNFFVLKEWKRTLSQSTPSLLAHYDNGSIHSFFLKNLPADKDGWVWVLSICVVFLAGLALLGMMAWGKKKNVKQPEVLESSFLFVLIPLFSPLSWYYNYFYPVLAVVFLINWIDRFPRVMKYILIANFICIGASLREFLGKAVFRFYTQHSLVALSFLIILFYLFYIRLKMASGFDKFDSLEK